MTHPTHLTIDNTLVPVLPLDFNPESHSGTPGTPLEVVLPVPLHLVSNIDSLNDYVSLYLTTSDCGLEDISLTHLPNPLYPAGYIAMHLWAAFSSD